MPRRRFALASAAALAIWLPGLAAAAGTETGTAAAPARIVQQRLPDGSIVLTDRPRSDARIERSWTVERDAPGADVQAARRRAEAAREAAETSERIARQLEREQQRVHELTLLQQQLAAAEAQRAAVRAQAEDEAAWLRPVVVAQPPHMHPPSNLQPQPPRGPEARPPRRPAPAVAPRAGTTSSPRQLAPAGERPD